MHCVRTYMKSSMHTQTHRARARIGGAIATDVRTRIDAWENVSPCTLIVGIGNRHLNALAELRSPIGGCIEAEHYRYYAQNKSKSIGCDHKKVLPSDTSFFLLLHKLYLLHSSIARCLGHIARQRSFWMLRLRIQRHSARNLLVDDGVWSRLPVNQWENKIKREENREEKITRSTGRIPYRLRTSCGGGWSETDDDNDNNNLIRTKKSIHRWSSFVLLFL